MLNPSKTEINELSETNKTIYCCFGLKANARDCGNLVWFCFKISHLLLLIIVIVFFG